MQSVAWNLKGSEWLDFEFAVLQITVTLSKTNKHTYMYNVRSCPPSTEHHNRNKFLPVAQSFLTD